MRTIGLPLNLAISYCPKCGVVYYGKKECQCDKEKQSDTQDHR